MPKINVSTSIEINAPAPKIYDIVSNLSKWRAWSPWMIFEPEAKLTVSPDNKFYEWEGKRVGAGSMTLIKKSKDASVDLDLRFLKPWKSQAKVRFELKENNDKTQVAWQMFTSLPFFMFWMKGMMYHFIRRDFNRGLEMLKDLVEDGKIHSALEFKGVSEFKGFKYVGIKGSSKMDDIGEVMSKDFKTLQSFFEKEKISQEAVAFSQYSKFNMMKDKVDFISGMSVKSVPKNLPAPFVSGELPDMSTYILRHIGAYRHLGNAWGTLINMIRGKEIKPDKKSPPFELYLSNPDTTEENEAVTDIHYPVK